MVRAKLAWLGALSDDAGVAERSCSQIEADAAPVIAELLGGRVAHSERIPGARNNALHRVELVDGRVLGVKQYARGRDYAVEGAALRAVDGAVPVPEILCTLDRVIAYRWLDGETLDACQRREPSVVAALAAPLGQLLGQLARLRRDPRPVDLAPALAQLAAGPARDRLGDALADALRHELEAARFDDPSCMVHGGFSADHVIVAPSVDRSAGATAVALAGVIDWETATTGSMLCDLGRLVRHIQPDDAGFRAGFERGHGDLPADWFRRARLLDATQLVARLAADCDEPRAGELRALIARAV